MNSHISREFRELYRALPREIQDYAKQVYRMWKRDPYHNGLQFKQIRGADNVYSVRIGLHWRALADVDGNEVTWFWIGSHAEYDRILSRM